MREDAAFAARKKRVTEQLGEAMLAAVGLMVRQYMGVPAESDGGTDSADAARENAQTLGAGETVNESFDMARYLRLSQGASAVESGDSGERADAEDRPRSARRTERKTVSVHEAAGDVDVWENGEQSVSVDAEESGERADAEDRPRSVRRTERKTVSAHEAAVDADVRENEERSVSVDAQESGEQSASVNVRREGKQSVSADIRKSGERSVSAAASADGAERHATAEVLVPAEGGDALRTARSVSGEFERDARRYDGGFYLY